MAADILAYDSDTVPVGDDQVQHIEVCRDLAGSFNHHFGETFVMPKAKVLDTSAKVPGTDGEKMSKSYNNTLEVFEDPKAQRKKIMRITTDSRPMEQPKEPDGDHLFQLYSLVATDAEREAMAALYRRGGFGYGEVKKALADAAEQVFCRSHEHGGPSWPPIRKRFERFWPTAPPARAKKPAKCWPERKERVECGGNREFSSSLTADDRQKQLGHRLSIRLALVAGRRHRDWRGWPFGCSCTRFVSPLSPLVLGAACGAATAVLARLFRDQSAPAMLRTGGVVVALASVVGQAPLLPSRLSIAVFPKRYPPKTIPC